MPLPSQSLLRALDTAANPPLVERGEGPSPEFVRASQIDFGRASAAQPAVVEAQAVMSENMRRLIEVDEADRRESGALDASLYAHLLRSQEQLTLREALRANHPQVSVDVNPQEAWVEFCYRGERVRATYPYASVPDLPHLRARAIDRLSLPTGQTATEVMLQQEAAMSRAARSNRMWMDEAAAITADAWRRMETGHARAGTTTSTAASTNSTSSTISLADINRAASLLDAAQEVHGTRISLNRPLMYSNGNVANGANRSIGPAYNPPTDPEEMAKALGVVEDQTLAALRKLKQLGWVWDGKDWVYRMT